MNVLKKKKNATYILININSNSGGWLQLGCRRTRSLGNMQEFQDMEIVGEYSDEGGIPVKNIKVVRNMRMLNEFPCL